MVELASCRGDELSTLVYEARSVVARNLDGSRGPMGLLVGRVLSEDYMEFQPVMQNTEGGNNTEMQILSSNVEKIIFFKRPNDNQSKGNTSSTFDSSEQRSFKLQRLEPEFVSPAELEEHVEPIEVVVPIKLDEIASPIEPVEVVVALIELEEIVYPIEPVVSAHLQSNLLQRSSNIFCIAPLAGGLLIILITLLLKLENFELMMRVTTWEKMMRRHLEIVEEHIHTPGHETEQMRRRASGSSGDGISISGVKLGLVTLRFTVSLLAQYA
ncbi:hypothetical protein GIB67_010574 [Kingdonia uniflora]|uniref:Uncharacterized protein n=1 Tax=Kingdonia uniflora TaxID=39325 RepID=A0A7J7MB52_9MAGN|nr:hypothetical protein GIB67_010574 [Kingdonia uniflora]